MQDVNPPPFNARTRVHEYGGGAYCVVDGRVYFTHFADQRLYRSEPGLSPAALTPDAGQSALRYADFRADRRRDRLIAVREDHRDSGREPRNELVAISLETPSPEGGRVLVSGRDFYSTPRVSPDGTRLAWLCWDHPNMPWDGTELWVAELAEDGAVVNARRVAGGPSESIVQPEWSPACVLHFVSDRSGWWNLYRCGVEPRAVGKVGPRSAGRNEPGGRMGEPEPLTLLDAEFATPQWVFGLSTYGFAPDGTLICSYTQNGLSRLAAMGPRERQLRPIAMPFTDLGGLRVGDGFAVFVAGSPTEAAVVARLDLRNGAVERLRTSSAVEIDAGYLSAPEA
ncbi:MAG TPA: S9 family peptidase, partial [Gammaproteobacteria bacterium]|nr:S9 family peptidase [Gammaproteobacteria bacterium]